MVSYQIYCLYINFMRLYVLEILFYYFNILKIVIKVSTYVMKYISIRDTCINQLLLLSANGKKKKFKLQFVII